MIPAFARYVLLLAQLRAMPAPVAQPRPRGPITHCVHGHLYDEANTHIGKDGKRNCRACAREYWHRKRAARASRPPFEGMR